MNFLKHFRQRRKTEKGNIFFMLFAAVGVVGALGVGSTTILKGPVSTMVKSNQVTMIENRAELDLKLMINNVINSAPSCDTDDEIEAMEWRDALVGEPPAITGGGYFPQTISGATTDPWGRELGYCTWDIGTDIDDPTCGGASQKRLIGSASTSETYVAVVSAGPDQKFQTICQDFTVADANGDGDLLDAGDSKLVLRVPNSDDIVKAYSYDELRSVVGDNFLFSTNTASDADALTTDQGIEVPNDVSVSGILDMNMLGGTLSLSDVAAGALCNVANENQIFRDSGVTPPAIVMCQGGSFVPIGGGGASSDSCSGSNTGICIGFDPEKANCTANNGTSFTEVGFVVPSFAAVKVWTDGTYIYSIVASELYAHTFDGTTFTQVGYVNTPGTATDMTFQGPYIFVATENPEMTAYTFDGTAFTQLTTYNTGGGNAYDIEADDNYIYLFTAGATYALSFDGTSFTNLGVAVGNDPLWSDEQYIYSTNYAGDELRAYTFDGGTSTLIDTLTGLNALSGVWGDGDYLYVASGNQGVKAISFDGSTLTEIAAFNPGSITTQVWSDGVYIYAVNDNDNVYALSFDGSSFTEIDRFDVGDNARDVWGDGTYLYVAANNQGIRALSGFACTAAATDASTRPEIDTKTDNNVKVYGWGENDRWQLADNAYDGIDQPSPVSISSLSFLKSIEGLSQHGCGIDYDNNAWCWGNGEHGRVGVDPSILRARPTKVAGIDNVKSISTGYRHTCAVKFDGTTWCWGRNNRGQLGSVGADSFTPRQVSTNMKFSKVFAGNETACAVTESKQAFCWGSDSKGALGNGSLLTADQFTPSKVKNLSDVVDIMFPYEETTCALKNNGEVWCWGSDDFKLLGNGPATGDIDSPMKINIDNVIQLSSGGGPVGCALKEDGTAWCWGDGFSYPFGTGFATSGEGNPDQVINIEDFVKIAGHCGLRANGEVWCWGRDDVGQLGNGTPLSTELAPVKIDSTLKFHDIVSDGATIIAITKDYTDGNESLPVAPVIIQQAGNAGESTGSHGLAITYNGSSTGDFVGIALTVDEDSDSGDPASVTINTRVGSSSPEFQVKTNSTDIARLKSDNFTIGYENGVLGSRVTKLQIGAHDGAWSSNKLFHDGLLISKKNVTILNPSYFGVNKETGETTILSGRELLIQHTNNTGSTVTPIASFLNNSSSKFFGVVNVRGGDVTINAYTDTANEFAAYQFLRYRGDETTPTTLLAGDDLGRIRFRGYGNGAYNGPAQIRAETSAVAAGNVDSHILMSTAAVGSNAGGENSLFVNSAGEVKFNATVPGKSLLTIGGRGAADEGVKFSNDTTCANVSDDAGTVRWTGVEYEYCDGSIWLPLVPSAENTCTDDEIFYDFAAGERHSCGVLSNGQAVCWGRNRLNTALGNASLNDPEPDLIPISRHVADDIIKIATGADSSCLLTKQGEIKCWGYTNYGNTGLGSNTRNGYPSSIISTEKYIDVDIENDHACGVTDTNKVLCWGRNNFGQLGDGTTTDSFIPVEAYGIDNAVAVSAGWSQTCALLSNKTVKCWGENNNGELGRGTITNDEPIPGTISGLTDVINIDLGGYTTEQNACATKTDGTVWCWGDNGANQLGQGSSGPDQSTPIQVTGITNAIDVAVGWRYMCILKEDSTVECFGSNSDGKTGDGSVTNAVKLKAGRRHACVILQDGSMQCWGANDDAQLGAGTGSDSAAPIDVINPLSCNADKYVFVTSTSYAADFGGLKGADAICQSHADQVRLPGTYKAWMSDDTDSPATRFNRLDSAYDYKLVNDVVVADGWDDLTDGTIDNPIIVTEENNTLANDVVPTNTAVDGTAINTTDNCNNWSSRTGALNYNRGRFSVSDSRWTDEGSTSSCNSTHKIYCFQQ